MFELPGSAEWSARLLEQQAEERTVQPMKKVGPAPHEGMVLFKGGWHWCKKCAGSQSYKERHTRRGIASCSCCRGCEQLEGGETRHTSVTTGAVFCTAVIGAVIIGAALCTAVIGAVTLGLFVDVAGVQWRDDDGPHLGKFVLTNGWWKGKIIQWTSCGDDPEEEPALWKVLYDDGDGEDLEKHEVLEALVCLIHHHLHSCGTQLTAGCAVTGSIRRHRLCKSGSGQH